MTTPLTQPVGGAGSARASACPHDMTKKSYDNKHYTPLKHAIISIKPIENPPPK